VAYSAATGRRLWVRRYNGPGNGFDIARSVAVSPGGGRVFVTGGSRGRAAGDDYDYATVAYSAATGRRLWVSRYNRPEPPSTQLGDTASAVAVSPGGGRVFVTGSSWGGRAAGIDYATVAYSAATGRQLWVSRHNKGFAHVMAVSPDGTTVFVTGEATAGPITTTPPSPTAAEAAGAAGAAQHLGAPPAGQRSLLRTVSSVPLWLAASMRRHRAGRSGAGMTTTWCAERSFLHRTWISGTRPLGAQIEPYRRILFAKKRLGQSQSVMLRSAPWLIRSLALLFSGCGQFYAFG